LGEQSDTGSTDLKHLPLPIDVEHEQVQADYTNGLLVVTLPKAEHAKPKQIAVSVAG
jgi:HSP20 family protein